MGLDWGLLMRTAVATPSKTRQAAGWFAMHLPQRVAARTRRVIAPHRR
jgi:hypothetical protein